jgi:hypothetical protein
LATITTQPTQTTRVERIWNKNGKILSLEKPEQPI